MRSDEDARDVRPSPYARLSQVGAASKETLPMSETHPVRVNCLVGLGIGGLFLAILLVAAFVHNSSSESEPVEEHKATIEEEARGEAPGEEEAKLLCFSFAMLKSSESTLLAHQYVQQLHADRKLGVGIFGCDKFLVFSDGSPEDLWDASIFPESVVPGDLALSTVHLNGPAKFERGGPFKVVLCSPVFKKVWRWIFTHPFLSELKTYEWYVKVDPDAVFIPGRLRAILSEKCREREERERCETLYWTNWGDDMHGPIEVISHGAVAKYRDGHQCETTVNCSEKGEDWCLQDCLNHLHVPHEESKSLLMDFTYSMATVCDAASVAFHPYKSWRRQRDCFREVQRAEEEGSIEYDLADVDTHLLDRVGFEEFLLDKLGGKKFTYIVNAGNAGDALIQWGTMLLFQHLGLKFNIATPSHKFTDSWLVYAGAGNLVGLYHDCKEFLMSNAPTDKNNNILLLPATIWKSDEVLKSLKSNVFVVCRENRSYEYVKQILDWKNVYQAEDMAFYINDLDTDLEKFRDTKPSKRTVALLFRTDAEKTSLKVPTGNHDFSAELQQIHFDTASNPAGISENVHSFVNMCRTIAHSIFAHLQNYTVIYTNRLHMCISGALMGRETYCYPNSYWKNEEVFKYSIKGKFSHFHFEKTTELPPPEYL